MIRDHASRFRHRPLYGALASLGLSAMCVAPVAAGFDGLFRFGYENGGDDIASFTFEDGDTAELEAGGELFFAGGARFYWSRTPLAYEIGSERAAAPVQRDEPAAGLQARRWFDRLESELSIGYKTASINASNGEADFDRLTLTAMQYYRFGRVRAGAGLEWHRNPELDFEFDGERSRAEADSAVGAVLAVDVGLDSRFFIGLRGLAIEYDAPESTVSADSLGFYVGVAL